jgi:hypothetical protein
MTERNKILEGIYAAIDEINEQLPEDQNIEKSLEMVLLGSSGKLGSINLLINTPYQKWTNTHLSLL